MTIPEAIRIRQICSKYIAECAIQTDDREYRNVQMIQVSDVLEMIDEMLVEEDPNPKKK